jgi:hypothetical protein
MWEWTRSKSKNGAGAHSGEAVDHGGDALGFEKMGELFHSNLHAKAKQIVAAPLAIGHRS